MTDSKKTERRRAWIEKARTALAEGSDLHLALATVARELDKAEIVSAKVGVTPFISTSFPGRLVITLSGPPPEYEDVVGSTRVGPGAPLSPPKVVGKIAGKAVSVQAVDQESLGGCTLRAIENLFSNPEDCE